MQYKKIISGNTVIEYFLPCFGKEIVLVNGRVVSKKKALFAADHRFKVIENGKEVRFYLSIKEGGLELRRNGQLEQKNLPTAYLYRPFNRIKLKVIQHLEAFKLKSALLYFQEALKIDKKDPDIYFYMACTFSLLEQAKNGFEALARAVEYKLYDPDLILTHDMLAFLRTHDAFEGFLNSGFKTFDPTLFIDEELG